jgi:L-fucose isomerase-like protein
MPSAFEGDGTGAVSMYPLQLAGGKAAALAGWNKQLWARRG